jgi:hypothetical protein
MLKVLFVFLISTCTLPALGQAATASAEDQKPLAEVIKQVTSALQQYQDNRGSGATQELPPLTSAEFDFKTTTATTGGFTLSLFIFKFGTSHEKDVVNDVTYTYALPPPKSATGLQGSHPPPQLKDELAQTIQEAAKAVRASSTAAGLPFSKLTVNVQYGVKWDVNGSGQVTYSFVTVGLSGDKNKNTVQSVKLVFGK